MERNSDPKRIR